MFHTILIDLDDTILDFGAAERAAMTKTLRRCGLEPTETLLDRYRVVNLSQWEAYERGEISRDTVLVRRFSLFFGELGMEVDPQAVEDIYRGYLGVGHYFVPDAEMILAYLAPNYDLYLASNGVAATQYSRLESAKISHFFKGIFLSEEAGAHKPEKAYFDYCFARIPEFDPTTALMIGDSLTSDILGGKNAGIRTCWFNPNRQPRRPDIQPDYEIFALSELKGFL